MVDLLASPATSAQSTRHHKRSAPGAAAIASFIIQPLHHCSRGRPDAKFNAGSGSRFGCHISARKLKIAEFAAKPMELRKTTFQGGPAGMNFLGDIKEL
jgi:hypothetical protein